MDNAMYVSLSRQMTLRRELDIVANNIANADTAGFKVDELMVRTEPAAPARTLDGPRPVKFVLDNGVARDFAQGALRKTGGAFDLAIDGQGFFGVQTAAGERYTRDGRFTLDPQGRLVTQAGDPVSGEGGGEIIIDPQLGEVSIGPDGVLTQNREAVGKIAVVRFDDLAALDKDGDNLFRNVSNAQPQPAPDAQVRQGMLEGSNVQTMTMITRLIEINRAYERTAKLVDSTAELSRRSIERMGRVN